MCARCQDSSPADISAVLNIKFMNGKQQNNQPSDWQSLQKQSGNWSRLKGIWFTAGAILLIIVILVFLTGFFRGKEAGRTLTPEERQDLIRRMTGTGQGSISEEEKQALSNRMSSEGESSLNSNDRAHLLEAMSGN